MPITTKRQCANWLETFDRWLRPRTEAPASYIYWAGLYTLACCLKRKVFIPRKILGGWDCYPNLFVFFVGPPGLRKTVTMEKSEDLLRQVPQIARVPQSATQESIMALLKDQKDSSLAILSKEFGNLYKNSTTKLIEFLTAAFDGNKEFDNLTLIRGHELIYNPSVNLLAATTPRWIGENFTASMLEGGFASRVIWVYEDRLRSLNLFYHGIDEGGINQLEGNLVNDLNHIVETLSGPIEISEEDQDFMDHWYRQFMLKEAPVMDTRIQGYVQRKARHALTIAILRHVAYSDDLRITRQDFREALVDLERVEKNMPKVFHSAGQNKYTLDIHTIYNYVKSKGKVPRKVLHAKFIHVATPDVMNTLISAMAVVYDMLDYDSNSDSYSAKELAAK